MTTSAHPFFVVYWLCVKKYILNERRSNTEKNEPETSFYKMKR